MKIAILDDGIDQTHPFFDPTGYAYPAGFPKGDTALHDAEGDRRALLPVAVDLVEVRGPPVRPRLLRARHARRRASPRATTTRSPRGPRGRVTVSGIAPRAYLGNYKVLTVPTRSYGLDGNAPEIAKAIDQAVVDGMNVINLSLGEPEVEPTRDVVVQALDNAAAAGIVPVVAAGQRVRPLRPRIDRLARERARRDRGRRIQRGRRRLAGGRDRVLLLGRADADLAAARSPTSPRPARASSPRSRTTRGTSGTARAWRRPTSPGPRRS